MKNLLRIVAITIILTIAAAAIRSELPTPASIAQLQVPFEGMKLGYYLDTTQVLRERTGIFANEWVRVLFHHVTGTTSKMDMQVNGTVFMDNFQYPTRIEQTIDFPTNTDTLLFLRNGGQKSLPIYAGPTGQSIPIIPDFSVDLTRVWNLHDETLARTPFGDFPAYRYRTQISSVPAPGGGTADLTFYAAFEKTTQVLVSGEVWATQGGLSAVIVRLELREANVRMTPGGSPRCVIATAAYGSELAGPVQFLREFRDNEVESTIAGKTFMTVFNHWYYSWAPAIAQEIESNENLRFVVRMLIMPLVVSLQASDQVFGALRPILSPETAILFSGITASFLVGLLYMTPLALVLIRSTSRRIGQNLR